MRIVITLSALRSRDAYAAQIVHALGALIQCFRHGDVGIGEYRIETFDEEMTDNWARLVRQSRITELSIAEGSVAIADYPLISRPAVLCRRRPEANQTVSLHTGRRSRRATCGTRRFDRGRDMGEGLMNHHTPEARQLRAAASRLADVARESTPQTVTIDGCTYRNVTPEGLAKLQRPHWYRAPRPIGAPRPVAPLKAAHDRDLETWSRRVASTIQKAQEDRVAHVIGRACGDGYYIVATDGHRALCRLGDAPQSDQAMRLMTSVASITCWFDVTPDLLVVLKRMRAVSGGAGATTLTVSRSRQRVIVTTRDAETKTIAQEWVPITGDLQPASIAINTDYLLSALGGPGLRIGLPLVETEPIAIETADRGHRVVIMPMREAIVTPVQALDRPRMAAPVEPVKLARSTRSKATSVSVTDTRPAGAAAVSVTVAPRAGDEHLSPAQKAWRTRKARVDSGVAKPTDWVAAGKKAWATRLARLQGAA